MQAPSQIPPEREPVLRDSDKPLRGQRALVTGANSGIGRAVAIALGAAGADVVINYVSRPAAAADVVSSIQALGVRSLAIEADVSNEAAVQHMFEKMQEALGGIEILVNNAGIQRDATIDNLTLEAWNRVISVNLTGQFLCSREAVRAFLRQGLAPDISCAAGKIICMSSVHDKIPWAGHANYAASKGGLALLMQSMAQELAPQRIRVNAISPGAVRTEINRSAWESVEALQSLLRLVPYQRIGEPEDIGRAAVWLASDASDYVTGTTLYVDGGMTLYPGFQTGG